MPMPPIPPMSGMAGAAVDLADGRFGGQQEAGDGGGVLQGDALDFERIDDSCFEHIDVLTGRGVEPFIGFTAVGDFVGDDTGVKSGVLGDLLDRGFDGAEDDLGPDLLIALKFEVDGVAGFDQGGTTADDDPLIDGRFGGTKGVVDTVFLLFHLGLGRGTDLDDSHRR